MRYLITKVTVHLTLIELTPFLSTDDYIANTLKSKRQTVSVLIKETM